MSMTLEQIYAINPTTVVADTDLYYLVQSPYTPGTDSAITGASLKAAFGAGGTINPGLGNQLAYYASGGSTISGLATLANGVLITSAGGVPSISQTLPNAVQDNITRLGTITTGTWNATTIGTIYGGTGLTSYILGDILYASAVNTLARLAGNTTATKNFLAQTGTGVVSAAPIWSTISASDIGSGQALTRVDDTNVTLTLGGTPTTALLAATSLTLGWTGTLSGTRGGTGVNNGANTATFAGNLNFAAAFTTSGAFAVTQTYTGITNVTFPTSGTLATTSQIPTGAALTKTDDTNVTLTLGGSPTTALVNAASLTLGWTGQLSLTRGGTNASLVASNGGIIYSTASAMAILSGTATARQMLQSGSSTTPAWSTTTWPATSTINRILYSSAANVIDEIATANNGVLITSAGGIPSISSTLPSAVQGNITSVGTIASGTWNGSVIGGTYGGTGVNNGASTITIGGSVTFSGAFTFTGTLTANTSVTFPTSGTLLTSASINAYEAEGRLTLTTNVPVTTSDVTAATTLYYTPYVGDHIALFDGSSTWTTIQFTQLSIAVPATTNTMYDVWIFNSSGTATLELLAWTNDTTRATALTYQNGILVKTGATTRRYVGSFRTTGSSGQTEDSLAKRYVWNYYNRVQRQMRVVDTTDTWTYSTATYRQANAAAGNQLDMVIGVSEDSVLAMVTHQGFSSTATVRNISAGIGLDGTTNNAQTQIATNGNNANFGVITATYYLPIAVGRHTLVWLEKGAGSDTQTWVGDYGATLANYYQTGIFGQIWG